MAAPGVDASKAEKAVKRLMKEVGKLQKQPLDFVSTEPDDANMLKWKAVMHGPKDSPYEGGKFVLELVFPESYPQKQPEVRFVTKIFHPHVLMDTGELCPDVITNGEDWSPTLQARHVLERIYNILAEPSSAGPLNAEAGELLATKPKDFRKQAQKMTKKHAR